LGYRGDRHKKETKEERDEMKRGFFLNRKELAIDRQESINKKKTVLYGMLSEIGR